MPFPLWEELWLLLNINLTNPFKRFLDHRQNQWNNFKIILNTFLKPFMGGLTFFRNTLYTGLIGFKNCVPVKNFSRYLQPCIYWSCYSLIKRTLVELDMDELWSTNLMTDLENIFSYKPIMVSRICFFSRSILNFWQRKMNLCIYYELLWPCS